MNKTFVSPAHTTIKKINKCNLDEWLTESIEDGYPILRDEVSKHFGDYARVLDSPRVLYTRSRKELKQISAKARTRDKILIDISRYGLRSFMLYMALRTHVEAQCNALERRHIRENLSKEDLKFLRFLQTAVIRACSRLQFHTKSRRQDLLLSRIGYLSRNANRALRDEFVERKKT